MMICYHNATGTNQHVISVEISKPEETSKRGFKVFKAHLNLIYAHHFPVGLTLMFQHSATSVGAEMPSLHKATGLSCDFPRFSVSPIKLGWEPGSSQEPKRNTPNSSS